MRVIVVAILYILYSALVPVSSANALENSEFQHTCRLAGSTPENRDHEDTAPSARSRFGGRPRRLGATQGGNRIG